MGAAAHLAHERLEALEQARRLKLVAQHGRQRQRQGQIAVQQAQQRHVAADDRLPQPLLAEGPGAKALHVGHVRVQHDRERAPLAARAHPRQTARKSSARSSSAAPPARRAKSEAEMAGTNQP